MAKKRTFTVLAGPTREIPSGQNEPISPAWVANKNAGFASSCPIEVVVFQDLHLQNLTCLTKHTAQ